MGTVYKKINIFLFTLFFFFPSTTCQPQQETWITFIHSCPYFTQYNVTVTFYTLSIDETDNTPTIGDLNTKLKPGRDCAVSRDLIFLLGKKIYISGYGIRKVSDLMNKKYKNRIDILVPNKKIAKKLGKQQNVKIIIIGR